MTTVRRNPPMPALEMRERDLRARVAAIVEDVLALLASRNSEVLQLRAERAVTWREFVALTGELDREREQSVAAQEGLEQAGAPLTAAEERVLRSLSRRYFATTAVVERAVDWPARFRAAADVADTLGCEGTASDFRDIAECMSQHVVEAIGRALLGEEQ